MKVLRRSLVILLTLAFAAAGATAASAQTVGALSIKKTCAAGVTGNAVFAIMLGSVQLTTVEAACNGAAVTATLPVRADVDRGAVLTIKETTVPANGVKANDRIVVLSGDPQLLTINNARAAGAPPPPAAAGALNITLSCASGVTGSGVFSVSVPGGAAVTVTVPCGQTRAVTANASFVVDATATISQTTAASGGVKAANRTVALTAAAQTVTITNARAAVGGATRTLARTGGGPTSALPIALAVLGLLLAGTGAALFLHRRVS